MDSSPTLGRKTSCRAVFLRAYFTGANQVKGFFPSADAMSHALVPVCSPGKEGGGPLEEFRGTLMGRTAITREPPPKWREAGLRRVPRYLSVSHRGRLPNPKDQEGRLLFQTVIPFKSGSFYVLRTRNMRLLAEDSIFPCHHQVPGRRRRRALNPTAPETRN